jgi:S-adenosylmethionine hydrolase
MAPVITLTTDFGTRDPFVGIMKGVLAGRAPEARVIDLTHGIPPQDVFAGALALRAAVPYFPSRTIHVAVVDPGVGGPRRPLCVETADAVFVGPDNGLLSLAAPAGAVSRIVHLTDARFLLPAPSSTFHGRDVFAPVAAALATGTPPASLGDSVDDMVRLDVPVPAIEPGRVRGEVIYVDHFGNLVTNVPAETVTRLGQTAEVQVRGTRIVGVSPSYGAVAPGSAVAVVGSWGLVEVAVRDGSAHATLGAGVGESVVLERR